MVLMAGESNLLATQAITAITTATTNPADSTTPDTTGAGDNSFNYSTTDQFDFTYGNETRTVTNFTAGGVVYTPVAVTPAVTLRRNTTNYANNVVWYRDSSFSGDSIFGYDVTVNAPHDGNMSTVFSGQNLNRGTDNIFVNSPAISTGTPANTGIESNGNYNNIERLDMVISSGIQVYANVRLAIFERGTAGGSDGFKIAAITAIDGSGNPLHYGALTSIAGGNQYGNIEGLNTVIERNRLSSPGTAAEYVSGTQNQRLNGISISAMADLGVTEGTTIYGYSLFGSDVTGSGDQLVDWNNSVYFPTNTGSVNGGLDLVALNVVYIPEPGSLTLLAAGAFLVTVRRRRKAPELKKLIP